MIPLKWMVAASLMIGAAAGYLTLWSVFWLYKLATGKEGMGYGDFKLLGAIGAPGPPFTRAGTFTPFTWTALLAMPDNSHRDLAALHRHSRATGRFEFHRNLMPAGWRDHRLHPLKRACRRPAQSPF